MQFEVVLTLVNTYVCTLDILFCQITTFIKVRTAFVFGLQPLKLIDFTKIFQLKGLKPKKKATQTFMNVVI